MAEWYCRLMGTEMGPYTAPQLIELAKTHRLSPEDLVRKSLVGEWVPAFRVRGLFDDASQPAHPDAKPSAAPRGDGVPSANSPPNAISPSNAVSPSSNGTVPSGAGNSPLPKFKPVGPGVPVDRTLRQDAKSTSPQPPVRDSRSVSGSKPAGFDRADWYCLCRGERMGPMTFDELERMAHSGELLKTDRVWRASAPKWHPASEIGGLQF